MRLSRESETRIPFLVAPATILKLGIVRLRPHRSSLLASFAVAGPGHTHMSAQADCRTHIARRGIVVHTYIDIDMPSGIT